MRLHPPPRIPISEEGVHAIGGVLALVGPPIGEAAALHGLVEGGEEEILEDGVVVGAVIDGGGVEVAQEGLTQPLVVEETLRHQPALADEPDEHEAGNEADEVLPGLGGVARRVWEADAGAVGGGPFIPRIEGLVELLGEGLDGEAGEQRARPGRRPSP